MAKIKTFFTYVYLRKDGTPYYVGKGRWARITDKNRSAKAPTADRILVRTHATEKEAFETEKILIARFGRKDLGTGCLRNLTDGGEGASGHISSAETRRKQSIAATGRKCPWNRGVPHPEARISMLGNKNGKGRKAGFKASLETREKMRIAQEKRWETFTFSEDAIRRMRDKNKNHKRNVGRVCAPETRKNISTGLKRYWATSPRRKAA